MRTVVILASWKLRGARPSHGHLEGRDTQSLKEIPLAADSAATHVAHLHQPQLVWGPTFVLRGPTLASIT